MVKVLIKWGAEVVAPYNTFFNRAFRLYLFECLVNVCDNVVR